MTCALSNPRVSLSEGLGEPVIRRARVADVPAMSKLINDSAEFGLMLPRSLASLYENVRDFHVAELAVEDQARAEGSPAGRVVGVCALSVVWANLAELASLAVAVDQRGRGIGKRLTEHCLDEARQLGIRKVMSLTYEQRLFEKLGFSVIDRGRLPHKVWSECVRCPKNEACDEIAMMRVFDEIAEETVSDPPVSEAYDVPVVLTRTAAGPSHSD